MGIQGISDYNSFFQNYRIPNIPNVPEQDAEKVIVKPAETSVSPAAGEGQQLLAAAEQEEVRNPVRKNADLENISLKFNTGEDYGYIGKDSDIASLDMQKAISDMKKDSVLEQYQYFIGSVKAFSDEMNPADGIVIKKSNTP